MQQFSDIEASREARGIEQKALAERAGLKPQSYSKLKKPSPRGPSEKTLQKLTAALNSIIAEQEEAANGNG